MPSDFQLLQTLLLSDIREQLWHLKIFQQVSFWTGTILDCTMYQHHHRHQKGKGDRKSPLQLLKTNSSWLQFSPPHLLEMFCFHRSSMEEKHLHASLKQPTLLIIGQMKGQWWTIPGTSFCHTSKHRGGHWSYQMSTQPWQFWTNSRANWFLPVKTCLLQITSAM